VQGDAGWAVSGPDERFPGSRPPARRKPHRVTMHGKEYDACVAAVCELWLADSAKPVTGFWIQASSESFFCEPYGSALPNVTWYRVLSWQGTDGEIE
jgi:hypothetical protein